MLDESAPLRPLTPYAESKVAAEEALGELAGRGFSPVAMRNATVYGVSPRLRLDIVLNNLVAWAHTTGAIRLQSDGTSWRPLVHVRDVARATLTLLEAPTKSSPERPSTSVRPNRTTESVSSPRSSTSASPSARSPSRRERRRIREATAWTSRSSHRRSRTAASSGRPNAAPTSSRACVRGNRPDGGRAHRPTIHPTRTDQVPSRRGRARRGSPLDPAEPLTAARRESWSSRGRRRRLLGCGGSRGLRFEDIEETNRLG